MDEVLSFVREAVRAGGAEDEFGRVQGLIVARVYGKTDAEPAGVTPLPDRLCGRQQVFGREHELREGEAVVQFERCIPKARAAKAGQARDQIGIGRGKGFQPGAQRGDVDEGRGLGNPRKAGTVGVIAVGTAE